MNRFWQWFYGTWLGGRYLEFLLWKDEQNETARVIDLTEARIVVQAQKLLYREAIGKVKRHVNEVVNAKNKEEYHSKLKQIEDLIPLAEREQDSYREFQAAIASAYVRKGSDRNNATDHAKMIDQRINDFKELREHKAKRQLLRDIRAAERIKDNATAKRLKEEFTKKYGKSR